VGYPHDGSALVVELEPRSVAEKQRDNYAAAGANPPARAAQILTEAALTVPVRVSVAPGSARPAADRYNDSSPWNGGTHWESWRDNQPRKACTTGFGVHSGYPARSFVLSAAHCASLGDHARHSGNTSHPTWYMGPIHSDQWQYDLLLIGSPGWNRIFDGGPYTGYTKKVNSWGYYAGGELVCQSGKTSGTVCNIRSDYSVDIIVNCATPDSDGDCGYTIYGVIRSTQIDGATAVRPGDSGGPVFTLDGTGVRAKGIVTAGEYSRFYFQDWADVVRLFGAYPNTVSSVA
jgi:hypothetical protein